MLSIDLNCDMGEGMPHDAALMRYISSANISCGAHAGDIDIMRKTIELAIQHKVAVGAHPSYPDKVNFGRNDLLDAGFARQDLENSLIEQLGLFKDVCAEFGIAIHHVKPHGALYNRAAKDIEIAELVCRIMKQVNLSVCLYGLSGSVMKKAAFAQGLEFANEVFADRSYQDDGSLTPRSQNNALIATEEQCMQQVLQMVKTKTITSINKQVLSVEADTICLHGDGPHALRFARLVREEMAKQQIAVKAP